MRRILPQKTFIDIALSIMAFLLLNAISGVVGNSVYAIVIPLWTQIITYAQVIRIEWSWIIIFVALPISLSISLFWWDRSRALQQTLEIRNKVIDLDDSCLRLLVNLVTAKNLKEDMRKLLEELLCDAVRTLPGDTYRVAILLPDAKKEYLHIRVHYHMSEESIAQARFYIGNEEGRNSERGVAGKTYLDGQLRVGHIKWIDDHCECDQKEYIDFNPHSPHPSYYSFVTVPITEQASTVPSNRNSTSCLGIICFDSHSSTVFDTRKAQTLLEIFGRRIASVLSIYIQLLNSHNQAI